MKIYLFYFKGNNLETPHLYAFTNNEEYYERFKESRNMGKFKIVKRNISKREFMEFASKAPSQQLTKTELKTKNKYFPTKADKVEIVCTWGEEKQIIVDGDEGVYLICKDKIFNPSILSMKMKKDLYKLGFFTIYQYLYQCQYIYEPLEGEEYSGIFFRDALYGDFIHEVQNPQNIKPDQLELFMYLFGGTIE